MKPTKTESLASVDLQCAVDELCDRFEQVWRSGTRPELDAWIPAGEPLRALALIELVLLEIDYRSRAGESVKADDYLARYPELGKSESALKRLLAAQARAPGGPPSPAGKGSGVEAGPPAKPDANSITAVTLERGPDGDTLHPANRPGAVDLRKLLAPAQAADELGRLGPYRVLKILGQGGMGMVLLAEDTQLARQVALKIMLPQFASDRQARERFLREARAAAGIRHDNVVTIFQVGEENGLPFIALECLEGLPLDRYLKEKGELPLAQTVRIGREIAEGLQAAHARNLVHRDIKPGNIWLEAPSGRVKVLDFGLARSRRDDAHLTQTGAILGTPAYMSPEQAGGKPLDQRSDLFSLGVVLYRLCAGKAPFSGNDSIAVIMALATETPTPVRQLNPDVPPELEKLIHRLLAKTPEERPASAQEVADALKAVGKRGDKTGAFAEGEPKAPRRSQRPAEPMPDIRRRSPVLLFAGAAVAGLVGLMVLCGTGTIFLWRIRGNDALPPPVAIQGEPGKPKDANAVKIKLPPGANRFVNIIGMEFALVPRGTAWLGGGADRDGRETEIPYDFYLGVYEVTQEEWQKVMSKNPSFFSRSGGDNKLVKEIADADLKRFPVENVTWTDAQEFVKKLNALEKMPGWVYRLPTESEWEYACRGGPMADKKDGKFDYYFAAPTNQLLPDQANFRQQPVGKRTCKVGSYKPNALGLFDMHGNLFEWCEDAAPFPDGTPGRALRGGSFGHEARECTATSRRLDAPGRRSLDCRCYGLRLARVPEDQIKIGAKALDPAWKKAVAAMPPDEQMGAVAEELKKRNPGFDGRGTHRIENGRVVEVNFLSDQVADLTPLQALTGLEKLNCAGSAVGKSRLSDLSGLAGMRLTDLDIHATQVSSLEPLRGMKLAWLHAADTPIADLSPLKGMPLKVLGLWGCAQVKDLGPLAGMPLDNVMLTGTSVSDLTPLKGAPITSLHVCSPHIEDLAPLKGMPIQTLAISGTRVRDLKPITGMPLVTLNLMDCRDIPDLTPLKGMKLQGLEIGRCPQIRDLSPLEGMPLQWISMTSKQIETLAPLKGMPLTSIHMAGCSGVPDLEPFKGMALKGLNIFGCTKIKDLTPLKGAPLTLLHLEQSGVTDLRPLQGMQLVEIRLDPKVIAESIEVVREMKSLRTVITPGDRTWDAAEFWKRLDAGEFK